MTASTVRAIHEAANPQSWKLHLTSTPKEMGNAKRKNTAARAILFLLNLFIGTPDRASRCHHTVDSITSRCRRIVAATPAATAHTAGSTHASCAPIERIARAGGGSRGAGRNSRGPTRCIARADAVWHSSSDAASTISPRAAMVWRWRPTRELRLAPGGAPGAGGNKRSSPGAKQCKQANHAAVDLVRGFLLSTSSSSQQRARVGCSRALGRKSPTRSQPNGHQRTSKPAAHSRAARGPKREVRQCR